MNEWYSAEELKGIGDLPNSVQGINGRAKRHGWTARKRQESPGRPWEYHISSLPQATRDHLGRLAAAEAAKTAKKDLARQLLPVEIDAAAAERRRQESLARLVHLPADDQARIDACVALVTACEAQMKTAGISWRAARLRFAADYNAGEIPFEPEVRALFPRVSASVLDKWKTLWVREGVCALRGRQGEHLKGRTIIDETPEVRELVIGMMVKHPHCRAKHVLRGLEARFADRPEIAGRLPARRTLQRWMTAWKNANESVFTAISNPDAWKNRFLSAAGSASAGVVQVGQRTEMDSTPGDLLLADGRRYTIIAAIDVYSRWAVMHVSPTSSAAGVAALTRKTFLLAGVSKLVVTDNGSDYISQRMRRAFELLGVEHRICGPGRPEQKPHIERFFHTWSHDLVELLPGYIGHNVAERQAIEARQKFAKDLLTRGATVELNMTPAELQAFCDAWCETVYGREPHAGLGGRTPFEMLAACREPVRRISDERVLDLLLAEAPDNGGLRKVGKKGLAIDNAFYDHPDLGPRIGEWVKVLYDEADIGRVYVFSAEDGAFICVAECPERSDAGLSRKELAALRREKQKQAMAAEKAALKAVAKRADTSTIVDEILAERGRAASNVALFPKPETEHEAPAIAEARSAVDHRDRPPLRQVFTPEDEEIIALERARMEAAAAQPDRERTMAEIPEDRRHLRDDREFALWIMKFPELATASDTAWLAEQSRDWSFRRWVGIPDRDAV